MSSAPADPVQLEEEEKDKVVSIWERLLSQNHKSKETKTYKKSEFAKIIELYEEKRYFALVKLDKIKSLELKQETENIDLQGDSHKLNLIYSEFAVFFARNSAVIFKHELMFTSIPFRDECFILKDLLDIAKKVPELEANCRMIISLMLNQAPHELDLSQLTKLVCDFTTSLHMVDYYCPGKMDGERFMGRLQQFSRISLQVGRFLAVFATNWCPTWEELGITHYLPLQQVNPRIRLSHWLAELSLHYRELQNTKSSRAVYAGLFEELGISRDSDFTTKDGSLLLMHPDTYAGQDGFEFLFED